MSSELCLNGIASAFELESYQIHIGPLLHLKFLCTWCDHVYIQALFGCRGPRQISAKTPEANEYTRSLMPRKNQFLKHWCLEQGCFLGA